MEMPAGVLIPLASRAGSLPQNGDKENILDYVKLSEINYLGLELIPDLVNLNCRSSSSGQIRFITLVHPDWSILNNE
jgi:hypothetical protein